MHESATTKYSLKNIIMCSGKGEAKKNELKVLSQYIPHNLNYVFMCKS